MPDGSANGHEVEAARAAVARQWLATGALAWRSGRRLADAASLAAANVHAVGIGRKFAGGRPTGTLCVRVHVRRKLPRALVPERFAIPRTVRGVPTDVVESPPARVRGPLAAPDVPVAAGRGAAPCSRRRREARRPLVAGVSVAHRAVTAGTIAAFCRSTRAGDDPAAVYLLSNNHVLADVNRGTPEDDVYQPGPYDGGTAEDHVADLARFVPVRLGGRRRNRVDAALARLRADVAHVPEVCTIGRVRGTAEARDGLEVRKHGRTTGLTEGVVTDVSLEALVGMDDVDPTVEALFEGQIRVAARGRGGVVGLGGDSGSLVVTAGAGPRAVGLYFAGPDDGSYGLANPIGAVLELLEADLL